MTNQMENHDEREKILRYACVVCDKLFNGPAECYEHVTSNHTSAIRRVFVRATYREPVNDAK